MFYFIGTAVGYSVSVKTEHIRCPKDLTRALQGCEMAAMTINNMLFEAEWETFGCREKLVDEKKYTKKIIEAMFQYGWSPLDEDYEGKYNVQGTLE